MRRNRIGDLSSKSRVINLLAKLEDESRSRIPHGSVIFRQSGDFCSIVKFKIYLAHTVPTLDSRV